MTDIEFIQALRAVAKKYEGKPVATFETNISNMATDAADRIERLCDEINRQKAEIVDEREKKEMFAAVIARQDKERAVIVSDRDNLLKENNRLENHFREVTKMIRAEAIREFAERLKLYLFIERGGISTVSGKDIDNLVKEMTEDKP